MADNTQLCDFCKAAATYDGKTTMGPWAFMCEEHFVQYGIPVKGLYNILKPIPVATRQCAHCGIVKPLTDFYAYIDHNGYKRHRTECKACNLVERKNSSFAEK